jgi:hypothetical protein
MRHNASFRNGLFVGLIAAAAIGTYLFQLWGADNQVHLHTEHLIAALQDQDWSDVEGSLDPSYLDQWGENRAILTARLRGLLSYAKNLKVVPHETMVRTLGGQGTWSARVTIEADPNEVSALIKDRVNGLGEPFTLEWRKKSRKPWDWKLVRVSNPTLELSGADL